MNNPNVGSVPFGVWSNSPNTTVAHLTIRDTYENALIFNAGAQSPHIYSVKLIDSGSQFVKVNPTDIAAGIGVDNGILEHSWMEYVGGTPTHPGQVGYTNGISAHSADNWIIRGNMFKNFHVPDSAEFTWNPAVLMWNRSTKTLTEKNIFINVDRAIAYGLTEHASGTDHQGGTIRNNFVYLEPGLFTASRRAGADATIIVYDSPDSDVYHNTILSNGNLPRSIEFRFARTTGGSVRNNLADVPLGFRDGAAAAQSGNLLTATAAYFADPSTADLHLVAGATAAIDQAPALGIVTDDFDGNSRPQGGGYDIGADEFMADAPPGGSACDLNGDATANVSDVQICANQAIGAVVCATGDINRDGFCNVIDVQRVVNAALGELCITP